MELRDVRTFRLAQAMTHMQSIGLKYLEILLQRRVQIAIGILGVGLILVGYVSVITGIAHDAAWPANTDYGLYSHAGDQLAAGASPYEFAPGQQFRYVYPPLLADIVALVDRCFGPKLVWILWPTAAALSLVGGIALAMRGFGVKASWGTVLLVAGVFMTGHATRVDLFHGQINHFILLLMVAGLFASNAGRPFLAALCWSVVIVFKPFLGVIVLYLMWKRRWRDAFLTLACSGVLFLASFAPTGGAALQTIWEWIEASHFASSPAFAALPDNQSFYGMLVRITTPNPFVRPWLVAPAAPGLLLLALYGLCVAVLVRFVSHGRSVATDDRLASMVEFQIPLALFMACGPLTEGTHLYFVFPVTAASALIWSERMLKKGANRTEWGLVALAWAACFVTVVSPVRLPLSFVTEHSWELLKGPGVLLSGRFGFNLMLAAVASAWLLHRERPVAKAPSEAIIPAL
jgi:hypothetical protein